MTSSTSPWLRRAACGEPPVADFERPDDEEREHRGIIHDISKSSSDEHEFVLGHLFFSQKHTFYFIFLLNDYLHAGGKKSAAKLLYLGIKIIFPGAGLT